MKKNIILFSSSSVGVNFNPHTVLLATKMNTYANQNNIDIYVDITSVAIDDKKMNEGDIILLTPEVSTLEKEMQEAYPNNVIKIINQEDYGFVNAEKIIQFALS